MATTPQVKGRAAGALLRYRIMAFTTGVVLLAGTIALIVKAIHPDGLQTLNGVLWVGHGWLYLIYAITTLDLGLRLRWKLIRIALVMLAGTIPTMSFVAEHFVTRATRAEHPEAVAR
ncbi:MAG: DUF3817 domain-containing protein [Jatrophihabitantaceae bacterium]